MKPIIIMKLRLAVVLALLCGCFGIFVYPRYQIPQYYVNATVTGLYNLRECQERCLMTECHVATAMPNDSSFDCKLSYTYVLPTELEVTDDAVTLYAKEDGYSLYGATLFKTVPEETDFDQANATCREDGGFLAVLDTQQKRQDMPKILASKIPTSDAVWIGLRLSDEDKGTGNPPKWLMENGSLASFNPSTPFVFWSACFFFHLNTTSSNWEITNKKNGLASCTDNRPFVCEKRFR